MMRSIRMVVHRAILFLPVTFLLPIGTAHADIPEPPALIYGSLENSAGLEVTGGDLRFDFVPTAGGQTVRVNALVGSLAPGVNFVAEVAIESNGVSDPASILERQATYTPRVYYNAVQIADPQLSSPLTAERGEVIGPIAYVVNPTGALASVSHDIDFGIVKVGEYKERSFLLSNPGTVALSGSCALLSGQDFKLMENDIEVSEIAVALAPGETKTVSVRFEPTAAVANLSDTFRVSTNADPVERSVTGSGSIFSPEDFNTDGIIDWIDIWTLALYWHFPGIQLPYGREGVDLDSSGTVDHSDLMMLIREYKKEP